MDLAGSFARAALSGMILLAVSAADAGELHVAPTGDDRHDGSRERPFRTISAAARAARAGDVVTVHEGVYREWVDPPRGGDSDSARIVFRAAPGDKVEIKGSEIVRGWTRDRHGVWSVTLPNSFFGAYNPYSDTIHGDWFNGLGRRHHTGAVYLNGDWLDEAAGRQELIAAPDSARLWYAEVDGSTTKIWARFGGADPTGAVVEVNARQAVFYPRATGVNYVTVRGFVMRHAATAWAPPTAAQMGLVGPHWSRGWIIEKNVISHSKCSGVTLGKYGDEWDNTSANSAEGYVKTIERATARGWSGEVVGHHIVRNNTISDCEQAGIVGSLGAIFSRIEGNHLFRIHVRRLFSGDELAAIKLHGAIDVVIRGNRIHDSWRGLWLDWMAQGTRVTGNLFYRHAVQDIFVEVNHGPFLVDNNLLLSTYSLSNASEGGAYVHNLFAGAIAKWIDLDRLTPFHPAHSTVVAGLVNTRGGDDRFFNNIFAPAARTEQIERYGLKVYGAGEAPVQAAGNVYFGGAAPYPGEDALVVKDDVARIALEERADGVYLRFDTGTALEGHRTDRVTSQRLGIAAVPRVGYENPDGSPLAIDADYLGVGRNPSDPGAGPFAKSQEGAREVKVW